MECEACRKQFVGKDHRRFNVEPGGTQRDHKEFNGIRHIHVNCAVQTQGARLGAVG